HEAGLVVVIEIPANVYPALRLVVEVLQRRRLDGVDRNAGAVFHDPDDAIARDGPAWCELYLHVAGEPPDRKRGRPLRLGRPVLARLGRSARYAEHHAGSAADVEPAFIGGRLHRHAFVLVVRIDRPHDVEGRKLSAPDRSNGVLDILLAKTVQRGLEAFARE